MFSNIVVGTDGSETAALAVALAVELAKEHGAVVHLVHAYKVPASGVGVAQAGPTGVAHQEAGAEMLKAASRELLYTTASSTSGVKVETHSHKGPPPEVVMRVAEEVGAEVIVVGSKGMRGARRVLGSVPNSIAHRAPCHVLIAKTA